MTIKQGDLSISSENIFPIIKKWLYSDHDIFYREMVSNGCDAVTKRRKLALIGETVLPDDYAPQIRVALDPEKKTVSFSDNGIGMTAEEVDSYINQIAFSGARDFLEKYKDKAGEDQIIGHFGLGFYSAFMVADRVEIQTLSCAEGAAPVRWVSEDGMRYEMEEGSRTEAGTTVTLSLSEDSYEFCNEYRAREVLEKYCSFMPVPIYLDLPAREEPQEKASEEASAPSGQEEGAENGEAAEEKAPEKKEPEPINDVNPLWTRHPNECTEEDYKAFYRKVFRDYKDPLFWIHLNMDYPFNLKGILYFPKINTEYDTIEGTIKLYNSQVFVADNIKEVIPEYFMLLKGVIDCPDLPLNVSRSALQNDGFVKKISDYIAKKVADKLSGICKTDRETYEKYWDDIAPFVKFGCLRDEKFRDRVNDYVLYRNLDGKYLTLPDLLEENKETHPNTVFYVTDEQGQSRYIDLFKSQQTDAVFLTHNIDVPFVQMTEQKNENVKFVRIDSDLSDTFREEMDEETRKGFEALAETVRTAVGKEKLTVRTEKLKDASVASLITVSEDTVRMRDMMKMYGMGTNDEFLKTLPETLVLNVSHPLVKALAEAPDGAYAADIACQLYDLARISHEPLDPEEMKAFVERSTRLLSVLAEK